MTSRTRDGEGRTGITLTPVDGRHTATFIFLHGLGDQADGWSTLLSSLSSSEEDKTLKFVLPNAPPRPISLNGGMTMPGWSDVFGLSMSDDEDLAGFEASRSRVRSIIEEEKKLGTPIERIVLGGFSQGGALALFTALSSPDLALGGVVVLSSWLPCRSKFTTNVGAEAEKRSLPLLQVHGKDDKVVSFAWGKTSNDYLSKLVTPAPRFLAVEGMGHHADEEELEAVKHFLRQILGDKH